MIRMEYVLNIGCGFRKSFHCDQRGYLIPSPRRHELETLVALYLKDKFHSDLQDARRIISVDPAEDTCWIEGRGDCTEV